MEKETQFNSLSKQAAVDSSDQFFIKCMEMVNKESELIWYKVKDVTAFEQECFSRIYRCLDDLPVVTKAYVYKLIKRVAGDHVKNRSSGRNNLTSLDALAGIDDEGSKSDFQLVDVLADVESEVLANEKVALLARGDSRNKTILLAWKNGFNNDTQLARHLAILYGGNVRSITRYIQRFRIKCQERLADAA